MLTGTAAENEAVEVETITTPTENCNEYHSTVITITQDPNDPSTLKVFLRIVRGYDDAGTFVQEGNPIEAHLTAAQVAPYLAELVTNGETRKRSFKTLIWDAATTEIDPATSETYVPAGTVS